jgi:hypothetical protein
MDFMPEGLADHYKTTNPRCYMYQTQLHLQTSRSEIKLPGKNLFYDKPSVKSTCQISE